MIITDLMTKDHRGCDELFADAENAVHDEDWSLAAEKTGLFLSAMEQHFEAEEQILFPAFEAKTGMTQGPTAMMRLEHDQMRTLFAQMQLALDEQDDDEFLGTTETLLIVMQQHNMKEESMLYPMTDQHLAEESAALSDQVQAQIAR